jgi:hypothetical protein
MTAELKQAIQMAQSLSHLEQLQLLQVLSELLQKTSLIDVQNQAFWHPQPIKNLLQTQHPPVIQDLNCLAVDFWEDDESDDYFLFFLDQQRSTELRENR